MITNFLNKGSNFVKKVVGKTGAVTGFAGAIGSRLAASGLPAGGIFGRQESVLPSQVASPSATQDWALTLSLPKTTFGSLMEGSEILSPAALEKEFPGIRFPTTPAIFMSHSASYDARTVIHNNYPYYAYQNSQVDAMTINASFPVQDTKDGLRWLSNLHFLRTITKMYYGKGTNVGNPPPICRLNGYGDYVFQNVPVIVTNFTMDLRQDVDYIAVNTGPSGDELLETPTFKGGPPSVNYATSPAVQRQVEKKSSFNYVPTDSQITLQVVPVYSRNKIANKFDLKSFAEGKLADKGFI